jgi:CubicO group peptidase (beta-lactamase class C family)
MNLPLGIAASAATTSGALALLLAGAVAGVQPADPADPAVLDRVDAFVEGEIADAGIPGLAIAIVAGGEVVHVRGFGVADGAGRPVTPDTPFQLASLSKAFTATAVMQLVSDGAIDLDAPVTTYLPWFRVGEGESSAGITIRRLLNHTSGIPSNASAVVPIDDGDDPDALERRIRGLAQATLSTPPGDRYAYGNPGYEVLGLVIQAVSGEPYDEYIGHHIFEPLRMTHSHVLAADAFADGASEGFYRWYGLVTAPWRTPYPRATGPAGVTFSSARDMAEWALFQLGHEEPANVLDPAAVARMHARTVQYDVRHWYGMGWVIRPLWEALDDPPKTGPITDRVPDLVEHGGAWETAHTYIGLVPERDLGIVVLANINDRTMSTRYYYTELGILNILAGGDPLTPILFEPPLIRYGKQLVMLLFALQLVTIPLTVRTVRRTRAGHRPRPVLTLLGTALALAVDGGVLYLLLVVAPGWYGTTLRQISNAAPDVGPLMVAMTGLALVWAPLRTILLLRAVRSTRATAIT